jgi:ankyrin repeat protein
MKTHGVSRRGFVAAGVGALVVGGTVYADEKTETPAQAPGPKEAPFERDYDPPGFKPSWKKEQINRTLLQDFVIYAHSDLEMVKKLLEREPGMINGAIDWGGGDFETALGGASHMGRRDIVSFLLERGARIDIFCAAMMGQLEAVKSFLTLQPALIDAKGPHGFSLHMHAQAGGDESVAVLDYLQSIKKLELRPLPFLQKKEPKAS